MFILIGLQFSYLPRKHAHAYLSHLYNLQLTDKLLVSFFLHWILSCKWILVNIIYCLCAFSIIYVSFLTGQQGGYCKLLRGCLLPQEILKKKKQWHRLSFFRPYGQLQHYSLKSMLLHNIILFLFSQIY